MKSRGMRKWTNRRKRENREHMSFTLIKERKAEHEIIKKQFDLLVQNCVRLAGINLQKESRADSRVMGAGSRWENGQSGFKINSY